MTGTARLYFSLSFIFFAFLTFCSATSPVSAETQFTVSAGQSKIDVSAATEGLRLTQPEIQKWVQNAADAVVAYYGRYPVPLAHLQIRSFDGHGVRGGQTFSNHGGFIRIAVGIETTPDELSMDWMLTHEMVHLTFPNMQDEHHWIEEGLATYVEPIARIQAGQFSVTRMWFELIRDMPKGLPREGDQGLDHTHTWGRTYWGGALFCFLADVEIRKQTQNKKGLQDALRGILSAGGNMIQDWSIDRALQEGDKSVGVNVLTKLYGEMRDHPMSVDLQSLWNQLGIQSENGSVKFNDSAPLAAIRKSITESHRPSTSAS